MSSGVLLVLIRLWRRHQHAEPAVVAKPLECEVKASAVIQASAHADTASCIAGFTDEITSRCVTRTLEWVV